MRCEQVFVMKSKLVLGIICVLFPLISQAQFKQHKWVKPKFDRSIPDSLKSEDAVKLLDKTAISIDLAGSGFITTKTKFIRIKLQTERGVERYAKVYLEKEANWKLIKIDARSIHEDGKITDLDKDQIMSLGFTNSRNESDSYEEIRFSIPNAKVGDIIEITYSMTYGHFINGEDVFLYSSIPCLNAQYKLSVPPQLAIESKAYNGMPEFEVEPATDRVKYIFNQKGLPGLGSQDYSIPHRELPFAVWAIRGFERNSGAFIPINSNSWSEYYNRYSEAFDNNKIKKSAETGAFSDLIEKAKKRPTNVEKVETVMQGLKELELVNEELVYQDLNEFIGAGKINYWTCHYFITQALTQLGISNYVCFGRSKYEGLIDLTFASAHQIRFVFYAFKDEDGRIQFVSPPFDGDYKEVGELPISLYDTDLVILPIKDDQFKNPAAFSVNLKMIPAHDCIKRDVSSVQIDLEEKIAHQSLNRIISGPFSTSRRHRYIEGIDNDWLMEIDFFKEKQNVEVQLDSVDIKYPYRSTFSFEFDVEHKIEFLEDTLITIPLAPFMEIELLEIEAEVERVQPFYGPYNYQHQLTIEMNFDQSVHLIEDVLMSVNNEYGRLQINGIQKSEKQIIVNALFSVDNSILPISKMNLMHELNKKVKELTETELLLSIQAK
ncbi:MAG: hypothetical protein ACI9LS_001255 [Flavobacteriales bacterium]